MESYTLHIENQDEIVSIQILIDTVIHFSYRMGRFLLVHTCCVDALEGARECG